MYSIIARIMSMMIMIMMVRACRWISRPTGLYGALGG